MNKFHKKNKKRCEGGFSFIEILIGIALLLVVSLGLYGAFQLCIQLVGQSKARITALSLASQQMEMIRNLPYNSVGTQGGIPTGSLLQSETIIRNDIEYELKTSVIYIDDPFDGTAPADTLAKDYKRVRTEVSWIGRLAPKEPVILITDIVPKGIETEAGGGTLSVSVFDASGIGVGQAEVHIVNNQV
ncbi:prepilin-type N-terminal cleavage/methylation domain-containing protein, partial [Patescibacteria group bacterium]|nr:prepilin-type N-terminal cleavage/methylation domain-containing protein [Patescibacteria group bacterium]